MKLGFECYQIGAESGERSRQVEQPQILPEWWGELRVDHHQPELEHLDLWSCQDAVVKTQAY